VNPEQVYPGLVQRQLPYQSFFFFFLSLGFLDVAILAIFWLYSGYILAIIVTSAHPVNYGGLGEFCRRTFLSFAALIFENL